MGRPDAALIRRNAQVVFAGAGETALVRRYVSGTTGAPRFGVSDTFNYAERMITGLFHIGAAVGLAQARESLTPGGESQAAQLFVTTDEALGAQDELVWRGTAYRVDGQGTPQVLGGRVQWRSPLRLAAATG